jgi:hypothetical protein
MIGRIKIIFIWSCDYCGKGAFRRLDGSGLYLRDASLLMSKKPGQLGVERGSIMAN